MHKMLLVVIAMIVAACAPAPADKSEDVKEAVAETSIVSEADIRLSYLEQGARAQLHRWWQYYEEPSVGLQNQLDILSADVIVSSLNGTAENRDEYAQAVTQLPSSWRNAHFLKSSEITYDENGMLRLKAEITYLNTGILPDGAARTSQVFYDTTLVQTESALPEFKNITITQGDIAEVEGFKPAYVENRLLSLIHYWMALVEHPERKAEPFREILAETIDFDFSSGAIVNYEDLAEWVAGPASSVEASRHYVHNLTFQELGDNRYELTVDLDWNGIRPDRAKMTAKTRHTWTVVDTPSERFARIEKIRVEFLEPFAVVD